jgi:hypothetical protein
MFLMSTSFFLTYFHDSQYSEHCKFVSGIPALARQFHYMTQEDWMRQSVSGSFVLMTTSRAPLCCATDSCQGVIVFSHRLQPMLFRVPAEFVLIFKLQRNASVSHNHLFCWLLSVWSDVLEHFSTERRSWPSAFTLAGFEVPISARTTPMFTDLIHSFPQSQKHSSDMTASFQILSYSWFTFIVRINTHAYKSKRQSCPCEGHSFLTSALNAGEWLLSLPHHNTSGEISPPLLVAYNNGWGLEPIVYATVLNDVTELQRRVQDGRGSALSTAGMLETVRQVFVRRAERCVEAQRQDFENFFGAISKHLRETTTGLVISVRPALCPDVTPIRMEQRNFDQTDFCPVSCSGPLCKSVHACIYR